MLIFGIFSAAILLRLWNLDKETGLWYDEMSIFSIASQSFPFGMLKADAHRFLLFPLYYLDYHIWIKAFGESDFVIRLMSVFFDVLSMGVIFLCAMEFPKTKQDENICGSSVGAGICAAFLYAINATFLYYSQEAKFYSLTFFLVGLMMFFALRLAKGPNTKNVLLFCFSGLILMYTHVSQVLLVTLLVAAAGIFLLKNKLRKESASLLLFFILSMFPMVVFSRFIPDYFSGNFDAVVWDWSFVLQLAQNLFSPVLVGLQNNYLNYNRLISAHLFDFKWILYIFFPVVFYLSAMVLGLRKNSTAKVFGLIFLLYLGFHLIFSVFTSYGVLVRYILPAFPLLIPICALGFQKIVVSRAGKIFTALFLIVNLLVIAGPVSPLKIERPAGYKSLAQMLEKNRINPDSTFVLPIRTVLLDKYFKINGEKISLYSLNGADFQKTYLRAQEIALANSKDAKYQAYKRFLLEKNPPELFQKRILDKFAPKKRGQQVVVITDKSICLFSEEQIREIAAQEGIYEKYPIQFLRMSKLNNFLILTLQKRLSIKKHFENEYFSVSVFEKTE